ncbi:MAG: NfeD family protein [candidate division NC10 bacterium]|nr:NfeD family protein [candidate division NC10 bacterium]
MHWWLWLVLGLMLVGLEVLTPGGFYVLFFGIGALVVGTLSGLGWGGPIWFQWLLFSVLSVASLLLCRPHLIRLTRSKERLDPIDTLVGETAVLTEDVPPGATGKAELRGTTWTVLNRTEGTLRRGQRSRVEHVDGLTLWVRGQ